MTSRPLRAPSRPLRALFERWFERYSRPLRAPFAPPSRPLFAPPPYTPPVYSKDFPLLERVNP
jgi:hypothetical protein